MYEYWRDEERLMLDEVCSYEHAAELAISILTRMRETGKEVVQICGPMSTGGFGTLDQNMARFRVAIKQAQQNGLLVFNQIPFQGVIIRVSDHHRSLTYDMAILEVFYRKIFECGHVSRTLFLPGWESSRGARWEREFASSLGIPTEDYPHRWLHGSSG